MSPTATVNGSPAFCNNSSVLVRSLEAVGFTTKQADTITVAIINALNHKLNEASHTFLSKAEMQRSMELRQEHISAFKPEIKGLQSKQFLMLEAEMVKLQNEARGVETEMILERLRTNQAAAIANISYELKRELSAAMALLDASNETMNVDLQGMIAQVEAFDCWCKYWVGAASIGGLAVGLMN